MDQLHGEYFGCFACNPCYANCQDAIGHIFVKFEAVWDGRRLDRKKAARSGTAGFSSQLPYWRANRVFFQGS